MLPLVAVPINGDDDGMVNSRWHQRNLSIAAVEQRTTILSHRMSMVKYDRNVVFFVYGATV
jgi:hypothetical protein